MSTFNQAANTSAPWVPYKIPPTVPSEDGRNYGLSFSKNADPNKNPSQFLEWKDMGLPDGVDNDMLKWAGDKWVTFSPSGSSEQPTALQYDGQSLFWKRPLPDGSKNDLLRYDEKTWVAFQSQGTSENPYTLQYNGEELFWGPVALPRGANKGDLLYWDPAAGEGGAWVVLSAPSGEGLKVLTFDGGNLAWASTQDC
jgi:hypothetical protein